MNDEEIQKLLNNFIRYFIRKLALVQIAEDMMKTEPRLETHEILSDDEALELLDVWQNVKIEIVQKLNTKLENAKGSIAFLDEIGTGRVPTH